MNYEENGREVPIWSYVFGENENENENTNNNKKNKVGINEGVGEGRESSRVWVGREGGEESNGSWIGVWEFKGVVGMLFLFFLLSSFTNECCIYYNSAYCKSNLIEPRLCVTVTITFRDDLRLEELLESLASSSTATTLNNDKSLALDDDDEYMIESFDGKS